MITFTADDDDFEKFLSKLLAFASAPKLLLEQAGIELMTQVSLRFQQEGPGWEPLAERTTIARRNKDKSSIKILQDKGDLMRSVITNKDADSVYQLSDRELLIGSNSIKANTHQYGNPDGFRRGINIPARPFLPTSEEMAPGLERVLTKLLARLLDGGL